MKYTVARITLLFVLILCLNAFGTALAEDELIVNDYGNTDELIEKFPVLNPTPVEAGIGEQIQNRLLTGFENWNRGFDAWKAWGNILYTEDSIYNVHGVRLTLAEYQAAMDVTLQQTGIKMGAFRNMIICDDWAAIHYDITTVVGDNEIPGSVMEFVHFKDYGDPLGTRVLEGWGGPKDGSYAGMCHFQGEENQQIQREADEALLAYEIPQTDDLVEKYPVLYPTTDNSDMAEAIRQLILVDFDSWNQGMDNWTEEADVFFAEDAKITLADGTTLNRSEYKSALAQQQTGTMTTKVYFDSMLISADWAAIHYRTINTDLATGEQSTGDSMQFYHFEQNGEGVCVTECWVK